MSKDDNKNQARATDGSVFGTIKNKSGYDRNSFICNYTTNIPKGSHEINDKPTVLHPCLTASQNDFSNTIPLVFHVVKHGKEYYKKINSDSLIKVEYTLNLKNDSFSNLKKILSKDSKIYIITMHHENISANELNEYKEIINNHINSTDIDETTFYKKLNIIDAEIAIRASNYAEIRRPKTIGGGVIPPRP